MAGRYKAYPEYKDSGAEWLGDLPKHWEAKRLGQFFLERREKVSDKDYSALSVTMRGIVPQLDTAAKTDAGDNRKLVLKNDFVINSRSDRKGSSGVSPYDGSVSLISIVLEPRNIEPLYVHHLLRSYPFQEEFYRFGKGIVADLWSTNSSEMKNIQIPSIPLPEQKQIAKFLDHETGKIDLLIEKQQALIALLKEKRQAVISHAVTKGLNPNAKMKDSGVEWLGQVPEHWKVVSFAQCVLITGGLVDPRVEPFKGYTMIAPNHIESRSGRLLKLETAAEQGAESGKYLCQQEEVIYSKIRPALAKACLCPKDNVLCSADMYPMRGVLGLSNSYLFRLVLTDEFTAFTIMESDRVAMPKMNRESLGSTRLPIPPEAEQSDIVRHIDIECSKIDQLVGHAELAAQLLQERRTALISAAVTGKIDVRDWEPAPEAEESLKGETV